MPADTISNQINRISNNIELAYSALYDKGATMPVTNNSALLADTINTISTGGGGYQEVARYMIDANGSAVAQAGNIDGRFKGIVYIDSNAMRNALNGTGLSGEANFCNLTNAGNYALFSCFENCTNITGVNFSSITSVVGNNTYAYAFRNCSNITGVVDFSNLRTISGINSMNGMFQNCPNITGVNFCNLTDISGGAPMIFYMSGNSNNPMTLDFSSLVNAGMYRAFAYSHVGDVNFPVLTNLSISNAFEYADVNSASFPSLVDVREMRFCFQNSTIKSVYMDNVINAGTSMSNSATDMGLCNTFANCNYLTDVHMNSLTRVKGTSTTGMAPLSGTFQQCTNLTNLYLPNLNEFGFTNSAYLMCWRATNLTTITIGGGDEVMAEEGSLNFNGAYGNYSGFKCLMSAFSSTGITSANLNLENADTAIGSQAFYLALSSCPNMTYVMLNVRETSSQSFLQSFQNCQLLSNVDLSISSTDTRANIRSNTFVNMVSGCSNLAYSSIQLVGEDDLTPVLQDNAFAYAYANSGLSDMQIEVYGKAIGVGSPFTRFINGCNNAVISLVSFDTTVSGDIFANMLAGTDGCTITFNSAEQSTIEGWASYTANFGGTNVTVSFE